MKVCAYCGGTVDDSTLRCPHCASIEFKNKCPRCGKALEGSICPYCSEQGKTAREEAAKIQLQAEAETRANTGLAWKTALAVLFPYVGGYFLIKDNVHKGFRVFGIIWCCVVAISVGFTSDSDAGIKLIAAALCLAPIAYYLFECRNELLDKSQPSKKLLLAAFVVVLVIVLVGCIAVPAN